MFINIPKEISDRMEYLFKIDEQDRKDGTPQLVWNISHASIIGNDFMVHRILEVN